MRNARTQLDHTEQLAQQLEALGVELLDAMDEDKGEDLIDTWSRVFTTWLMHPSHWAVEEGIILASRLPDRGRSEMQYVAADNRLASS